MARKRKAKLLLTDRALKDLVEIEQYSVEQFGRKAANKYLKKIEAALSWIKEDSSLLRPEPDFHDSLTFYRVEKHLLVCESMTDADTIVLTVINANMDIPSRLLELEPTLATEVAILRERLR